MNTTTQPRKKSKYAIKREQVAQLTDGEKIQRLLFKDAYYSTSDKYHSLAGIARTLEGDAKKELEEILKQHDQLLKNLASFGDRHLANWD